MKNDLIPKSSPSIENDADGPRVILVSETPVSMLFPQHGSLRHEWTAVRSHVNAYPRRHMHRPTVQSPRSAVLITSIRELPLMTARLLRIKAVGFLTVRFWTTCDVMRFVPYVRGCSSCCRRKA
jgi:hypothetical protein